MWAQAKKFREGGTESTVGLGENILVRITSGCQVGKSRQPDEPCQCPPTYPGRPKSFGYLSRRLLFLGS